MTLDEMIAVLTAAKEGKTIQNRLRGTDEKFTDVTPSWNFYQHDYRVKPEPREWFAILYAQDGLQGGLWHTKEEAKAYNSTEREIIRVREVMEDK